MNWPHVWAITWVVIKFLATVMWVIIRICLILTIVMFFGGFRGAARSKIKSPQS